MIDWTCRKNYPTRQKGRESADRQGPERSDECKHHILWLAILFSKSVAVEKYYFWTRVKSSGGEALNLITNVHRPGIKAAGSAGRVDRMSELAKENATPHKPTTKAKRPAMQVSASRLQKTKIVKVSDSFTKPANEKPNCSVREYSD